MVWMSSSDDTARPMDNASSTPPSPPSGPMTRSRAKALQDKVNSLLYMCDFDPTLDGTLPHANALCILRFEPLRRLQESMDVGHEDGQEADRKKQDEEEASSGTTASSDRYYRLDPEAALPPKYRPASTRYTASYTVPDRYQAGSTA